MRTHGRDAAGESENFIGLQGRDEVHGVQEFDNGGDFATFAARFGATLALGAAGEPIGAFGG